MKQPEVRVYAGPNGSGKSTLTQILGTFGHYINADEIQKQLAISNLKAAQTAEKMRNDAIAQSINFSFETVLSTDRNLKLLQKAKQQGYFIKVFYVLTKTPLVNLRRIQSRITKGGHDVPRDKVISRYHKALKLLPELIKVADVIHIYDNSDEYVRIYKKRKSETFIFEESKNWTKDEILKLVSEGEV
ncbi:MAG: zeta toxin family protein [Candidatus Ancillula sp.]|nr:zeta toxin family protein [Candidatus Ancillula sp.]